MGRTLTVEVLIFNSAKQKFCLIRLQFIQRETGRVERSFSFTTFGLEPYLNRSYAEEVFVALCCAYFTIVLAKELLSDTFALQSKWHKSSTAWSWQRKTQNPFIPLFQFIVALLMP